MDSLFKYQLSDIPDNYTLSCYYVVDDSLHYVSLLDESYHYLHLVDTNSIGDVVAHSVNIGDLDKYVYNMNKPITSMTCSFEKVSQEFVRVVRIVSVSGNPKCRKHKEVSERYVYNRYQNKGKKLF